MGEGAFPVEWLELRKPFDHAARFEGLVEPLGLTGPVSVVELGCGTGSGALWLRDRLPKGSTFTLVDHDPALLAAVPEGLGTCVQHDLHALEQLQVDADLVSCQALIDLVSESWLERFAAWVAARRVPVVVALTVDGRVEWCPQDEEDAVVQEAFRAHQLTDRGFGASPGPHAAGRFASMLVGHGYTVRMHRADWSIPADASAMVTEMVEGTSHAAGEMLGEARVAGWRARRLQQVVDGQLALTVGHIDLVAWPS